MANDFAASVTGAVIRVTRLNADGTTAVGPSASYIDQGFISVSFTPEIEEGDEVTQKSASGLVCTSYKAPDTLKRVTLEVALCNINPEIQEMMAGGTIFTQGGNTVGYAAPLAGTDPNPNGVALEVWSYAIVNGKRASVNPFWRFVFPYVKLSPSGDRVIENDMMANTYSGWGVGNSAFATGPTKDWPFISDRAYQYARSATSPINIPNGYTTAT